MVRAATRVQALEGIQSIEVTEEGIVVLCNPDVVSVETIVNAFYLQGLEIEQ